MNSKVKLPAIALVVVGVLGVLWSLLSLVMPFDPEAAREAMAQNGMDAEQSERTVQFIERFSVAWNVLGLAIAGFVIVGGIRMAQGKSWTLAVTASIVAMIPCWCCCILGIPVGIWSLIVLLDKDVKVAFGQPATPLEPPPL